MKNKRRLVNVVLAVVLLLSVVGSMAYAGQPGDQESKFAQNSLVVTPDKNTSPIVNVQASGTDDDPIRVQSAVAAVVNDAFLVQGRLTDANGVAINGATNVIASIYDVSVGGTARCSDADSVEVTNGLLAMNVDFCTVSDFNGDALWLGLTVGADPEMTPRQEILPVPYAWSLRPGAVVKGADSYVFISGSSLVKNLSGDSTTWDILSNGAARVTMGGTPGNKTVYYPVTLPSVLYGQPVTLEELTVYYRSSNAANAYITQIYMGLQTDASTGSTIILDNTDRSSTTATSYSLTLSSNNVLSASPAGLYFIIAFANGTDYVDIGAIRLRLGHQ